MSDDTDLGVTTAEAHEMMADDLDFTLEETEDMLYQLEMDGPVEYVGTNDDGEDMWNISSQRAALAYIARGRAKLKMRDLKNRFLGGGGDQ